MTVDEANVPAGHTAAPAPAHMAAIAVREPELLGVAAARSASAPARPVEAAAGESHWSLGRLESPALPAPSWDQGELALPAPAPSEPALGSGPLFGPMGRHRSVIAVPLLGAVTLGVYALIWHRRVNREMEEFDPKLHARPGQSMVAVAAPWLLGVLASLAGAGLIVGHQLALQVPFGERISMPLAYMLAAGLAAVPYLTLLLPFSAVAVVMTMERLRCVEEHVGLTADRQVRAVRTALLLLVPLVGGLILLAAEQRRLNAVWQRLAPYGRAER